MSDTDLAAWIPVKQDINDSMYWIGSVANPGFWADFPLLVIDLDPPWYHCKPCTDVGASAYEARLSIGMRFCPNCGGEIEWPA